MNIKTDFPRPDSSMGLQLRKCGWQYEIWYVRREHNNVERLRLLKQTSNATLARKNYADLVKKAQLR